MLKKNKKLTKVERSVDAHERLQDVNQKKWNKSNDVNFLIKSKYHYFVKQKQLNTKRVLNPVEKRGIYKYVEDQFK
ncbi:MAG: hypothetical protein RBQ97_10200 [Acholeplasma sp.]|nr:hypothetical protein [Acholeplasma sp.]